MMLGDLISQLGDETVALEALIATGDIALIAKVQTAAGNTRVSVGEFIADLIGCFGATAKSDDWIAVMSAAGRSEVPGAACLRVMLSVALANQEFSNGTTQLAK